MDIFYSFTTDDDAVENGRWFPLSPEVSLLIAKVGNRRFIEKRAEMVGENIEALAEASDEGLSIKLLNECLSQCTLLGWSGPLAYKGQVLEYSPESAELLLGVSEFRDLIIEVGSDPDNFRVLPD